MTERIAALMRFHRGATRQAGAEPIPNQDEAADLYRALDAHEVRELAGLAIAALDSGDRSGSREILRCLACLRPGSLDGLHESLIDRGIFYPPVIWHGAGSEIAAQIIDLMPRRAADRLSLNHMLLASAWIGDGLVQDAFRRWQDDPPGWAATLHVPPYRYAEEAGWELTTEGTRRHLFRRPCHPLVVPNDSTAVAGIASIIADHEGACGWCRRPLTTLLDLDLASLALAFLGLRGRRLRIATCDVCSCFAPVFTHVDPDGGSTWHDGSPTPDFLPRDAPLSPRMPQGRLVFGSTSRPWLEAANWLVPGVRFSQIGGHPTWVQDARYPRCPECGQTMPFVAQVSNEDIEEYGEGIYYAFACLGCGVAAVGYQQS